MEVNQSSKTGENLDIDLFKIFYLLWKNKFLLIFSMIFFTVISYLVYKFSEKPIEIYVDLSPKSETMPYLDRLDYFGVATKSIYRNYLASLLEPKILKLSLKNIHPNLNDEELEKEAIDKLNQFQLNLVNNDLSNAFQADVDDLKYKFFRLSYFTYDDAEEGKELINQIIINSNQYFINNFLETIKLTLEDIYKTNSMNQESKIKELESVAIMIKEKLRLSRLTQINTVKLNLEIADSLGIDDPLPELAKLISTSSVRSYEENPAKDDDVKLGYESRLYILGKKFLLNELEILNQLGELRSNELDKKLAEIKMQESLINVITDLDDISTINAGVFLEDILSQGDFLIVNYDFASIKVDTETKVLFYLFIGMLVGFLVASLVIFFENARKIRNLPL
tara:strand:- start:868 stop:2052 length:1185 start_codon:yes stop_codon:yes gene_type:complete